MRIWRTTACPPLLFTPHNYLHNSIHIEDIQTQTPVCFLYATVFALCRQVQASLFCLLHISHFGICHETWLADKGKKQIRQNKLAEYWVSGADEIPSVCTLPERTYTMVENTFDAIRGSLWALWSWAVFPVLVAVFFTSNKRDSTNNTLAILSPFTAVMFYNDIWLILRCSRK